MNGEATFHTRLLQSDTLKASLAMNEVSPSVTMTQTAPPFEGLDRLRAIIAGEDNSYYNVFPFGEDIAVLTDLAKSYNIDKKTLTTIGSFVPPIPGGFSLVDYTAPSTTHPIREFNTSNALTFATSLLPIPFFLKWLIKAHIVIYRAKSFRDREIVAEIPIPIDHVPMMHSFAASANYVILFAHPAYVDIMTILKTQSTLSAMQWEPDDPTNIYVVSLKSSKVLKLQIPAMFFIHHINSYEKGSKIIIDYVVYKGGPLPFFKLFKLDNILNRTIRNSYSLKISVMRITIDLSTAEVNLREHSLIKGMHNALDVPVINEEYRHSKACYVYGVIQKADGKNFATEVLAKQDLCGTGKDRVWFRRNHYFAEPRFVPRPGADDEDDGILMCIIMDGNQNKSFIGIFDPRTMTLTNKAYTPHILNLNVHGHFFPEQ